MRLQNCDRGRWCLCSRPPDDDTGYIGEVPADLQPNWAIEFTVATAAVALNSLIIYFILFKTPPELKDYRFFLFMITVSDATVFNLRMILRKLILNHIVKERVTQLK